MSKTFVRHPIYGQGWLLKIKKQTGVKVRFLEPTNGRVTRHLIERSVTPLSLREVEMLPLDSLSVDDVREALIAFYQRQVQILQKAIDDVRFEMRPGTVAEKLYRTLQDGVAEGRMEWQELGYNGLVGIARKSAKSKEGKSLFVPGQTDAVKDTATDIILQNLNGERNDIRWIGRQTRQRMIDQIRKQDTFLVLIGDRPDVGEGDGLTDHEILGYLGEVSHARNLAAPSRDDWRICRVCGTGFYGRSDAKTCSPTCRKALSRKCHTSARIDTGREENLTK